MIVYTLPDFTQGLGLNLFFCRLLSQQPHMCRENVSVGSIYGCFPNCALNGGRALVREPYSPKRIEETYRILAEYGLTPRLTLTNMLACEADLEDPYLNEILSRGARYGAEAIVASKLVSSYVKDVYGMRTVLSTTCGITDIDAFNAACAEHDHAVLDYSVHKDEAFLSALKHPERAEIMVNEYCVKGCPKRLEHYRHNSADQVAGIVTPFTCPHDKADFFRHEPGHPVIFTAEEVADLSERFHVHDFKIVGRGTPFATNLEALSYYLVRDEFKEQVKEAVMRGMRR